MTDDEVIETIFRTFAERGSAAYLGEPVSLTEHYRPALEAGLRSAISCPQDTSHARR